MFRDRRNSPDALNDGAALINQEISFWIVLRSFIFNLIFFPTVFCFLVLMAPTLLGRNPPYYVGTAVSRYILWLAKKICYLDCAVVGLENVPDGPCVLVSKHQSAWDTFVFLAFFPTAVYVSKKELEKIPVFGWYIKKHENISIDRSQGRKAMHDLRVQAKDRIDNKRKIVIFPEGSRTAPGQKGKYQKGVQALYKDLSCPFVPVALNSGAFWGRRSWIKYPGVITLQFLKPMESDLDKDIFMQTLQDRIDQSSLDLLNSVRET